MGRRKFRSNGKFYRRRNDVNGRRNNSIGLFSNGQVRSTSFKGPQNIQKLIEKYTILAKEALSSGDNILSESYLQHVDHFSRIVTNNNHNRENNSSVHSDESNSKNEKVINQDKSVQLEKNLDKESEKEVK